MKPGSPVSPINIYIFTSEFISLHYNSLPSYTINMIARERESERESRRIFYHFDEEDLVCGSFMLVLQVD